MYSALGFFRKHKTFLFSIGFLVLFSITVSYANPPTSPYTPGATLDPQCAPGSSNCYVASTSPITLQTNGTANGSQAKLNLVAGSGITLADNGTGTITITSTGANYSGSGIPSFQAIGGTASGDYSAAFGQNSQATGLYSMALGLNASATGNYSVALGFNTGAVGDYSTAFGPGSQAIANSSTAFGSNTYASGNSATAFGASTTAEGDNSTAFGDTTTADAFDSTAIGAYNIGGGDANNWVATDPLFEVGNGGDGGSDGNPNSNNPSDALLILKNGDTTVGGTLTSAGSLTVNGTTTNSGLAAPTNATATADENGDGDYTNGQQITYKIYAYTIVNGTREYSPTYATVQGPDDESGNSYSVDLSWNAVSGATGYRVVQYFNNPNFTQGADTTTNSIVDDDDDSSQGADFENGSQYTTVTPVDTSSGTTVFGNNIFGGLNIDDGINITGTSTTSGGTALAAPTNATATIDESGDGDYTGDSSSFTYNIYSYTLVNGVREYSSSYATVTGPNDTADSHSYSINLSWTAAAGATGYRVVQIGNNKDHLGADTTSTSMVDDDDVSTEGADFEPGSQYTTTTPSDTSSGGSLTYTNANTINGSITISGNSIFDGSGNLGIGTLSPSAPLEVTGLAKVGSLNVTGTASGGIPTPTGGAITFDYTGTAYNADGDSWTYKIYALTGTCTMISQSRGCNPSGATYSAPETVTATDNNSGDSYNVDLSWTAVPGATAYRIIRSADTPDGDVSPGWGFTTTATSIVDDGGTSSAFRGQLQYITVTPTSSVTYTNTNTINGNTTLAGNVNITGTLTCGGVSCGGSSIDLQTNGTANGSQSLLNLVAGTGITLSDDGSGNVTISSESGISYSGAGVDSFQAVDGHANGDYSFAAGVDATTSASFSVAMGDLAVASGEGSVAIGDFAHASNENAVAFGTSTASGSGATAFGDGTTASGDDSTSSGLNSIASGEYSIAMGEGTTASGENSIVLGHNSTASIDNAIVIGAGSNASNFQSMIFGDNDTSSGQFSQAFGLDNNVSAFGSAAFGFYNIGGGNTTAAWVATDPLFEIGNGGTPYYNPFQNPNGVPSDALMILKNGDTGIALNPSSPKPSYALQVGSSAITGVVARFQNSSGTCDINPTTASLTCSSDMTLKKNIVNLSDDSTWSFNNNIAPDNQDILSDILALKPVDYNWNTEADGTQKHAGFIAQEVQQVFPDLVSTDPTTHLLSLNYTGLIPYTIAAIQQMNLNVTSIDDLTKPDSWRDALEAWFADSANGIQSFFSGTVTTNQLCVQDTNGQTCLTRSQVEQLLNSSTTNDSTTTVISGGSSSDSSSDNSSTSANTSDDSDTTTPQTPDTSTSVVTPPTTPDPDTIIPDDATQSPAVPPATTDTDSGSN